MNKQLSALPDSKTTRITLPYNRQYVIFAVYEVLDLRHRLWYGVWLGKG